MVEEDRRGEMIGRREGFVRRRQVVEEVDGRVGRERSGVVWMERKRM